MTPIEELRTATQVLRDDTTPLHTAVAEWLDDTTRELTIRLDIWGQCYPHLVEANTEALFAYPLAVARVGADGGGGVIRDGQPCRGCTAPMVPQRRSGPGSPTVRHYGRGLCARCAHYLTRHGGLAEHPRLNRTRDELLDDYTLLTSEGHSLPQIAERLGMSYPAFEQALARARAAGDRRVRGA